MFLLSVYAIHLPVIAMHNEEDNKPTVQTFLKQAAVLGKLRESTPQLKHANKTSVKTLSFIDPDTIIEKTEDLELYKSLTAPPPKSVDQHILSLPNFLSDQENERIRDQLLNAPYTQTEAHYFLTTKRDPKNMTSAQMVDDFFDRQSLIIEAIKDNQFKNIITSVVEEEKLNKDKFVFYHATSKPIAFYIDVISAFRSLLNAMDADQLTIMRGADYYFNIFKDINEWLSWIDAVQTKSEGLGAVDHAKPYQEVGLAVNPLLFGGTQLGDTKMKGESSILFFYEGAAMHPPKIDDALNSFFQKLGTNSTYEEKYERIYNKYFKGNGGRLLQIFIEPQVVDVVTYSSRQGGSPWTFSIEGKDYRGAAKILKELRHNPNPFMFSDLYKNSSYIDSPSNCIFGNITDYQCRLFMTPEIFHNQNFINIKSYWKNPLSKEDMMAYRNELHKAISEDIAYMLQTKQEISEKTLFGGKTKLQRLYDFVHEKNSEAFNPNSFSPLPELQLAIEKGDFTALRQFVLSDPQILHKAFIYSSHEKLKTRDYVNRLLGSREFSFDFLWIIFVYTLDTDQEKIDSLDTVILKKMMEDKDLLWLANCIFQLGDVYWNKAFFFCCQYGSPELLEVFSNYEVDFSKYLKNIEIDSHRSPFFRLLDISTRSEGAALIFALHARNTKIVLKLLQNNEKLVKAEELFYVAVRSGQYEVLEYLLQLGNMPIDKPMPKLTYGLGDTPLVHAFKHGNKETVEMLVKSGADIKSISRDMIIYTLYKGGVDKIKFLLSQNYLYKAEELEKDIKAALTWIDADETEKFKSAMMVRRKKLVDYLETLGHAGS